MTTYTSSRPVGAAVAVGGGFCVLFVLLWRVPAASVAIMEYKSLLLTAYSIFIAGPLWAAYARLNNLDSLDGLRPVQSRIVGDFAVHAKNVLLRYFVSCVCILVFAIVLGMVSKAFVWQAHTILAVAIAVLIVFFVLAVVRVVETLLKIERTIRDVNNWRFEQKERNREVAELKRARAEKQLDPDPHLLRFRELAGGAPLGGDSDHKKDIRDNF
jgi:hypothetical protein